MRVAHHVGTVDAAEAGGCTGRRERGGGGRGRGGGGEGTAEREGALFGVQVHELEPLDDLPVRIGVQAVRGRDEASDMEGVLPVAGAQDGGPPAERRRRPERHHCWGVAAAGQAHVQLPREPPNQALLLQDHSGTLCLEIPLLQDFGEELPAAPVSL